MRGAKARVAAFMMAGALAWGATGCAAAAEPAREGAAGVEAAAAGPATAASAQAVTVTVNGVSFTATLADTPAAQQLAGMLPLTLESSELNGNEKYARLDTPLSTEGQAVPDTIEAGDVMLYSSDTVVLFYEAHANGVWPYVPLAHIDDASGLAEAVGSGDVEVTYELAEAEPAASVATQAQLPETTYTTQEIWVDNGGERIYGVAYVPDGAQKAPLAILSHGLGGTHSDMAAYAGALASHGYAAYALDFRGGSAGGGRSDGETTSMSVMTEASDLEAVIEAAKSWDFADTEQGVVLVGASQGGMVSAVVAAEEPDKVSSLVLLYPAFCIVDDTHERFASEDDIPEAYSLMGWITVGHSYSADVWDLDVYGEIGEYAGPVLIVHGDADRIVDVSYSERAAEAYQDAELDVIEGAGHGFYGDALQKSIDDMLAFLGGRQGGESEAGQGGQDA